MGTKFRRGQRHGVLKSEILEEEKSHCPCAGGDFYSENKRSVTPRTRGIFSIEKICHCLRASGDFYSRKDKYHPRAEFMRGTHHPGSVQSESAHPNRPNSQHSQLASEIICLDSRTEILRSHRAVEPKILGSNLIGRYETENRETQPRMQIRKTEHRLCEMKRNCFLRPHGEGWEC